MRRTFSVGLGGVIVMTVGRLASRGRLPRNMFVGIRIPSTMRSDGAWQAGHRAGASAMTIAGAGPITAAMCAQILRPSDRARARLFRCSSAWLLAWLGVATVRANRAARALSAP